LGGFSSCVCVDGPTTPVCDTCNNSCMPHAQPTLAVATDPAGPWDVKPIWPGGSHGP
jgi:hypothetical protein